MGVEMNTIGLENSFVSTFYLIPKSRVSVSDLVF